MKSKAGSLRSPYYRCKGCGSQALSPRSQLALPHHGQSCSLRYSITPRLPLLLPAASAKVFTSKNKTGSPGIGQPYIPRFDFPHSSSSTDSIKSSTLNGSSRLTPAIGRSKVITASRHPSDAREKSPRSVALSFVSTLFLKHGARREKLFVVARRCREERGNPFYESNCRAVGVREGVEAWSSKDR